MIENDALDVLKRSVAFFLVSSAFLICTYAWSEELICSQGKNKKILMNSGFVCQTVSK